MNEILLTMLWLFFWIPVALLLGLPALSELISIVKGARKRAKGVDVQDRPSLLFVVPAHNEELHIGRCVSSIVSLDYPAERIRVVVIADNCNDRTAAIAEERGADSLVRAEPENPGKPAALAWAFERISDFESFTAVVIIDADSYVDRHFARALAESGLRRNGAAQAYFDVANSEQTWLTRLGKLLSTTRYEVLYPRKEKAGVNCPLTGNGMCLGTDLFPGRVWKAFSLTENWELYADLTARGIRIRYVRGAHLFSDEAVSLRGSRIQRQRWLAGRWGVFRKYWREVLVSERIGVHQKLDTLAELSSPGPILHLMSVIVYSILVFWTVGVGVGLALVLFAASGLLPIAHATAAAIHTHERPGAVMLDLLRLPGYMVWRTVVGLRTVAVAREGVWRRSERSE